MEQVRAMTGNQGGREIGDQQGVISGPVSVHSQLGVRVRDGLL